MPTFINRILTYYHITCTLRYQISTIVKTTIHYYYIFWRFWYFNTSYCINKWTIICCQICTKTNIVIKLQLNFHCYSVRETFIVSTMSQGLLKKDRNMRSSKYEFLYILLFPKPINITFCPIPIIWTLTFNEWWIKYYPSCIPILSLCLHLLNALLISSMVLCNLIYFFWM